MKILQSCHLAVVLLISTNFLLASCAQWSATFEPGVIKVETNSEENVRVILSGLSDHAVEKINDRNVVRLRIHQLQDWEVASVNQDQVTFTPVSGAPLVFEAQVSISGIFIGRASLFIEIQTSANSNSHEQSTTNLDIIVLRPDRLIDTMFSVTIVFLLAILFVNFGAALELQVIRQIFRRPIGPGIGSVCQLIFMPLFAFGLGWALFPNSPELALGLFLTGIAPAGGASNIWALLLGGNINLSISMTAISTIMCFGTMPFWLFALGRTIFERANLGVPYVQVALVAAALLIPLGIGLLIQKFLPRVAKFLVRILKPLSLVFIIVVIILGLLTNLYLLQLFAWQILVASLCLPLFGYTFGWIAGRVFQQPMEDVIAISIETGVQNTGLTMFLIMFALEQPAADITMVVPIGVSIIGPLPLILFILTWKLINHLRRKKALKNGKGEPPAITSPTTTTDSEQAQQPFSDS